MANIGPYISVRFSFGSVQVFDYERWFWFQTFCPSIPSIRTVSCSTTSDKAHLWRHFQERGGQYIAFWWFYGEIEKERMSQWYMGSWIYLKQLRMYKCWLNCSCVTKIVVPLNRAGELLKHGALGHELIGPRGTSESSRNRMMTVMMMISMSFIK